MSIDQGIINNTSVNDDDDTQFENLERQETTIQKTKNIIEKSGSTYLQIDEEDKNNKLKPRRSTVVNMSFISDDSFQSDSSLSESEKQVQEENVQTTDIKESKLLLKYQQNMIKYMKQMYQEDLQKIMNSSNIPDEEKRKQQKKLQQQQQKQIGQIVNKNSEGNKKLFIEKYGIKFELPHCYTYDMKFIPSHPEYCAIIFKNVIGFGQNCPNVIKHMGDKHEKIDHISNGYDTSAVRLEIHKKQTGIMGSIKVSSLTFDDIESAFLEFSQLRPRSGQNQSKYLALCLKGYKNSNYVIVLTSKTETCFSNIVQGIKNLDDVEQEFVHISLNSIYFYYFKRFVFDNNNRFLICVGEISLTIIDLTDPEKLYVHFKLNQEIFDEIVDVSMISTSTKIYDWNIIIAAKKKTMNQIHLFDPLKYEEGGIFLDEHPTNQADKEFRTQISKSKKEQFKCRYFNFKTNPTKYFQVRINQQSRKLILANKHENYIFQWFEKHKVKEYWGGLDEEFLVQKIELTFLEENIIRYIQIEQNSQLGGFYLVVSSEYDTSFSVLKSNNLNYKIDFQKVIVPGSQIIHDLNIQHDQIEISKSSQFFESGFPVSHVRISGINDGDNFMDKATFMDTKIVTNLGPCDFEYLYQNFNPGSNYSFNWPYLCCHSLDSQSLVIVNAFDPDNYHKVGIPNNASTMTIVQFAITDSQDLIFATAECTIGDENTESKNCFKIYKLDLDASNTMAWETCEERPDQFFKLELLVEYPSSKVGEQEMTAIFARGQNPSQHENLQVFIQHRNKFYTWNTCQKQEIKFVSNIDNKIIKINADNFLFLGAETCDIDNNIHTQKVLRVTLDSNSYTMEEVFQETQLGVVIIGINIDLSNDNLIVLQNVFDNKGNYWTKFVLYSMTEKISKFEIILNNKELIGRFRSGACKVIDGHIYYGNFVIKLRYDIIFKNPNAILTEHQVFNYYPNLFILDENERMMEKAPFIDTTYRRMAYMISNSKVAQSQKIIILPFLHDRQIKLINKKPSCYYSYTSIEHEGDEDEKMTSILCMNHTLMKYYVYSEEGILKNRVDFSSFIKDYGQPITCSPNGINFIFRKLIKGHGKEKWNDLQTQILTVFQMTESKMKFVKDINVIASLDNCYQQQLEKITNTRYNWRVDEENTDLKCPLINPNDASQRDALEKFSNMKQHAWLLKSASNELKFIINDNMDVLIELKRNYNKVTVENHRQDIILPDCRAGFSEYPNHFFYIESGRTQQGLSSIASLLRQNTNSDPQEKKSSILFILPISNDTRIRLNNTKLVFFNKQKVGYFDFKNYFKSDSYSARVNFLPFEMCEQNLENQYIKDLNLSERIMAIKVINMEKMQLVTFCLLEMREVDVDNITKDSDVLWTSQGDPFVICDDHVIFPNLKVKLKTFNIEPIPQSQQFNYKNQYAPENRITGHRFDTKNHNWILFKDYLNLSFSYMTFVIKNRYEILCPEHKVVHKEEIDLRNETFDIEPYNYIFNKKTYFLNDNENNDDKQLYQNDLYSLQEVLKNLEESDPDLLHLLHYTQQPFNHSYGFHYDNAHLYVSPLSIALKSGNNRIVDIILINMSKINKNASQWFFDIFPALVQYQCFFDYLEQLPESTFQMQLKHSFRTSTPMNDEIVQISSSNSIFIDNHYYGEQMGELTTGGKNYPVEVKAIHLGWIFRQNQKGYEFFNAILETENIEIYDNTYIKVAIEYIYHHYKRYIIYTYAPTSIGKLFSLWIGQALYERTYTLTTQSTQDLQNSEQLIHEKNLKNYKFALQIASATLATFFIYQWYLLRHRFWNKNWLGEIIETTSHGLVILAWSNMIETGNWIRIVTVIALIMQFWKIQINIRLIDKIAPLITIIYKIIHDIKPFMLVMILVMIMASNSYYLLGKNQQYFDGVAEDQIDYITPQAAIWFVWNIVLGQSTSDSYFKSDGLNKYILITQSVFTSFLLVILLMNMLIAIMGDTFNNQSSVSKLIRTREHLQFICDNTHIQQYAFVNQNEINYLITAFNTVQKQNDGQIYNQLDKKMDLMMQTMHQDIMGFEERINLQMAKLNFKLNNNVVNEINQEEAEANRNLRETISRR